MGMTSLNNLRQVVVRGSIQSSFSNNQYELSESRYDEDKKAKTDKINKIKRLIRGTDNSQNKQGSILDSTLSYSEKIRESRISSKNTAAQIKKLKYNFKDISGQIRMSKTSVSAKQTVIKARREVIKLKMKLQDSQYDKEELEAALTHAKAMEMAARKKARHLEEEEMIKITDNANNTDAAVASEAESRIEEKMDEEYEASMEEVSNEISEKVSEEMSEDMYELLAESMGDMLEQTLGTLAESMMSITDFEMDDNEFKQFKLKHRTAEEKAMLEADAKYLKAMFDMYNRRMGGGAPMSVVSSAEGSNISDFNPVAISGDVAANIPNIVDISV